MKDATPRTIYLKEYAPPAFQVDSVDLSFELGEQQTRVSATLQLRRNAEAGADEPLVLNGEQLQLESLQLDGVALDESGYQRSDTELTIASVPDSATLRVVTIIEPQNNTSLEGLYKSSGNFCTQCEAEGFRKITYYPDRPDVMAVFTVTITADREKYPVLLSNGNPVESGQSDDGRHWVKWHDPYRKPSYLFALVAGDLAFIEDHYKTASGRDVQCRIYVQHHNIDQCDHAMRSLKRAMQWDEQTFGREYDLDVYNIVAVDDFNMGAMENKGLNVFNSKCVLAKPETATDSDFINIEGVIAHEYFHNWSGNRVTCRDWFQLTLKEGLTVFRDQQFTADMNAATPKRVDDVNILRTAQFREDAGPMAHPIQPDSYQEINNFYTVTVYNKGAEVIRMIHTLLGTQNFRKGMDLYFERHDGQAVTTEEFICAMEDASDFDLKQFRRWYHQAGTPVVSVAEHYDADKQQYTLTLQQNTPATHGQKNKEPFHIPVTTGLLDSHGNDIQTTLQETGHRAQTHILHLKQDKQQYVFSDVTEKPVASILRGFSSPVKVEFERSDDELAFCMGHDSDEFNRWDAGQRYASRIILDLIADVNAGRQLEVPEAFVRACEKILQDDTIDKAFVARALSLPSHAYIAESMAEIDADAIHKVREHMHQTIAVKLKDRWYQSYQENSTDEYELNPEAMGRHFLKNLSLFYLMYADRDEGETIALDQFRGAGNMTDQQAAFRALVHNDCPSARQVIDDFYQQWQHDQLVLDKWFMIQATAPRSWALDRVKKLTAHPDFDLRHPNRVRALLGSFCAANPVCFHTQDGRGYRLLGEYVEKLNSLNPQIAARLLIPMTQWRRYPQTHRTMMQQELQRLQELPDLSNDVNEIVSRSLDTGASS